MVEFEINDRVKIDSSHDHVCKGQIGVVKAFSGSLIIVEFDHIIEQEDYNDLKLENCEKGRGVFVHPSICKCYSPLNDVTMKDVSCAETSLLQIALRSIQTELNIRRESDE